MTTDRVCEVCSRRITGTGRRFCSHACYNQRRKTVDEHGRRVCRECGRLFDGADAAKQSGNWCASCRAAYYRRYNARISGPQRARNLRKYGITSADFDRLFAAQGGVCAICREPSDARLHVDHCHTSGQVRGLLCFNCNVGLGKFRDDVTTLLRAADYLLVDHDVLLEGVDHADR